jgi:hypothetical protein
MKEFNNIKNCRNIWKIIREFANGRQTFGEQNRIICKIENCIDNCFSKPVSVFTVFNNFYGLFLFYEDQK